MKKKISLFIAMLASVFSVCAMQVSAGTEGNLTYKIENEEVTITSCAWNASGEIVIPEKIEGLPVTSIGDDAFRDCNNLTSVVLPNSVKTIGTCAFYSCDRLNSINIPEGVTSIEDSAFIYCDKLVSINIPESVTSMGHYVFYDCDMLTSINIPKSITGIGEGTFSNCDKLTSVSISDGVTSIGSSAFSGCPLTSVTIPESVEIIGNYAFYGCSNLSNVTIYDSITSIEYYAFNNCTKLQAIHYIGTAEQFTKLNVEYGNECFENAEVVFVRREPQATVTEVDLGEYPAKAWDVLIEWFDSEKTYTARFVDGDETMEKEIIGLADIETDGSVKFAIFLQTLRENVDLNVLVK